MELLLEPTNIRSDNKHNFVGKRQKKKLKKKKGKVNQKEEKSEMVTILEQNKDFSLWTESLFQQSSFSKK